MKLATRLRVFFEGEPSVKSIFDIVAENRAALAAREAQTVKEILRAYRIAETRILEALRKVVRKINDAEAAGLQPSMAWLYQEARLDNLLREVEGQIQSFGNQVALFTATAQREAVELGREHSLRLGRASALGEFSGLPHQAFQDIVGMLRSGSPLKSLFDGIGFMAASEAKDIFAEGFALGYNPRKIGDMLAEQVLDGNKRRGELIARTESLRAYRTATARNYQANSDVVTGWRWTSSRNAYTCEFCLAMDGEIFPTEMTLESHPACRCAMVPVTMLNGEILDAAPSEDYFAALPATQQDDILGHTKGDMYRAGEIRLKDNVIRTHDPEWGDGFKARTIKELRELHAARGLVSQGADYRLYPLPPRIVLR